MKVKNLEDLNKYGFEERKYVYEKLQRYPAEHGFNILGYLVDKETKEISFYASNDDTYHVENNEDDFDYLGEVMDDNPEYDYLDEILVCDLIVEMYKDGMIEE